LQDTLAALPFRALLSLVTIFSNFSNERVESVIHSHPRLSRSLDKGDSVVSGDIPGLLHVDAPGGQVAFVADHDHGDLLGVLDPLDLLPVLGDVLEGLCVVDSEDDEEALARPHVLVSHRAVLLLTSGVEDIQQTRLPIDDDLLPVAVLDGGVVLVHEVVLYQLDRQRRLADAAGSDHDELVLGHDLALFGVGLAPPGLAIFMRSPLSQGLAL